MKLHIIADFKVGIYLPHLKGKHLMLCITTTLETYCIAVILTFGYNLHDWMYTKHRPFWI